MNPHRPGTLAYAKQTHRMALSNQSLAVANMGNVLPWLWLRWWRAHREINRQMAEVERRRQAHAEAMGWERAA